MTKALSLFFLLLALAIRPVFAQGQVVSGGNEQGDKAAKAEAQKLEASISPAEQAERDMLVPRKYQEQLAIEAAKPIKYGPTYSGRKSYHRKSSGRKYHGKKRKSSRRRR
jgi:hypothetical protein